MFSYYSGKPFPRKIISSLPNDQGPGYSCSCLGQSIYRNWKTSGKKLNVAFITQGDPSVYSSWSYLLEEANDRWPGIEIEIIPAVSSITAIPAVLQTPLADGRERFCVIPGTYGIEELPKLVQHFDTIVLTKVGQIIPKLVQILKELNILKNASYVSYATTDRQKIVTNLETIQNESCDYFSTVILSIRKRKGILRGQNFETE